jgi:glycerol-3-phosphate acyltransferase PlsY
VGGRLAVKIEPLYGRLSNNPLAGRTLRFDRRKRTVTSWTLNAESTVPNGAETGTNWTRTFAAPSSLGGTYDYRAHFDGDLGLDPSNGALFSIAWSAAC